MVPSQWKRIFQPPTRGRVERERKHKPPGNLGQPQPQTVVLNHINYLNINPHLSTILTRFTISTRFTILHQLYIYMYILHILIYLCWWYSPYLYQDQPTRSPPLRRCRMPSKYWRSCTTPHGSRALCWRLPKSLWLNRLMSLRKWSDWRFQPTPPEKIWVR